MVKLLIRSEKQIKGSRILILGVTFKENCPDIRNTKIVDVYYNLLDFGLQVDLYDTEADASEVEKEYGLKMIKNLELKYDGILLAVSHKDFASINLNSLKSDSRSVVYDLKGFFPRDQVNSRL